MEDLFYVNFLEPKKNFFKPVAVPANEQKT